MTDDDPSSAEADGIGPPPPKRSRRISASSSTGAAAPSQSFHPFRGRSVDATRLDIAQLREGMVDNDPNFVLRLDFIRCSDQLLRELFVTQRTIKRFSSALEYPPPAYRRTASNIRWWLNELGKADRADLRSKTEGTEIVVEHDDTSQWDGALWSDDLAAINQEGSAAAVHEGDADAEGNAAAVAAGGNAPAVAAEEIAAAIPDGPKPCQGFDLSHIRSMKRCTSQRIEELSLGFCHTVREGLTRRVQASNPVADEWKFRLPIVGSIQHGNLSSKTNWVLTEQSGSNDNDAYNQFEHFRIFDVKCKGEQLVDDDKPCESCTASRRALINRCSSNFKHRQDGAFNPNIRSSIFARTGSLQKKQADYHRRQSKNKQKKISRRDRVIDKMIENGIETKVNRHSDLIFCDDVQTASKKFLERQLGQGSIAEYAFARSVHNHKIAKEKGATAVRHCPMMVRLGACIRRCMGYKGGLYDLVAKICGLPCDRQLRKYTVSNSNDPDGIMHSCCDRARDLFNQRCPKANIMDFRRHTVLAYDAMHTKGRFGVSRNTNELVGIADDALDDDIQQAREGASALSGAIGMDGASFQFSSKSNSGNAAKATAPELMAPISITNK